jgi:hypothetical protein
MITMRRAMILMMSASERAVPVVGRSILSGFSGLVLCHTFLLDLELAILLFHPGHSRLLCLPPEFWLVCSKAILMPNVAASP